MTEPLEKTGRALSPAEVLALVPQQHPFRFIDEIVDIAEDHVEGRYSFRTDEGFYAGHFPGMPITPGVILLETMAQTGVVALGIYLKALDVGLEELPYWRSIFTDAEVEFLGQVLPGETVICRGEKIFWRRNKLRSRVEMTKQDGSVVAACTLSGLGIRIG
jgi:3-hydroxymyristoyl/3-hydroxydecanoyl-(acyl carrier protein) dehydratases